MTGNALILGPKYRFRVERGFRSRQRVGILRGGVGKFGRLHVALQRVEPVAFKQGLRVGVKRHIGINDDVSGLGVERLLTRRFTGPPQQHIAGNGDNEENGKNQG